MNEKQLREELYKLNILAARGKITWAEYAREEQAAVRINQAIEKRVKRVKAMVEKAKG